MNKSIFARLGHVAAFLLLALMALVQLNDPDPLYWAGLYGFCAAVPALALFNRYYPLFNWACLAYCVVTLLLSIQGAFEYLHHVREESLIQDMSPEKPYIEIAREFIGTLIALGLVCVYQILSFRNRRVGQAQ